MKRVIKLIISISLLFISSTELFSKEVEKPQNYQLNTILLDIDKPQSPIVTEDYIVFTLESKYRYAGIAFDYEGYQVVHPFKHFTTQDEEGVKHRKFMFYAYERKHETTSIKYRLVLDGLWTADPMNPNYIYDEDVNLYFSYIEDPESVRVYTASTDNNNVRFIYKGESGQKVHLAGTFTNWDPWIYELVETSPGFYELELPLTYGEYYYKYYIGLNPVLDSTNPEKVYTKDGRSANVIRVN